MDVWSQMMAYKPTILAVQSLSPMSFSFCTHLLDHRVELLNFKSY